MNWQKYENLEFLAELKEQSDTAVVLFHGYGADANDLASLGRVYNLKDNVDWFFPQGVLEVPIGPMMSGRAWFELRVADFEKVSTGQVEDSGMSKASEKVINDVSRWLNHLGKMYQRVFIGGFSQGAILTSHSFYRLNFSPAGLLLLSGYLVSPSSFPALPENLKVPFFQSHGQQDPVLKFSGAQKLYEKLIQLGLKGKLFSFTGGHEIPMNVIAESQIFLNSILDIEATQP